MDYVKTEFIKRTILTVILSIICFVFLGSIITGVFISLIALIGSNIDFPMQIFIIGLLFFSMFVLSYWTGLSIGLTFKQSIDETISNMGKIQLTKYISVCEEQLRRLGLEEDESEKIKNITGRK